MVFQMRFPFRSVLTVSTLPIKYPAGSDCKGFSGLRRNNVGNLINEGGEL